MKKRFLIFTVFTIFVVGCSSDSDGNSITEANVLGKWYLSGIKINNEPFTAQTHDCTTSKDFNEIFSNHHIVYTGYGTDCAVDDTEDNTWSLEGKVFSIIYDGSTPTDVYEIIKLTDTEMRMKQTDGTDNYVYYLNKI